MRIRNIKIVINRPLKPERDLLTLLAQEFVEWQKRQPSTSAPPKTNMMSASIHSAAN